MNTKKSTLNGRQFLLPISKCGELCKALLFVCSGYMFCYMFLAPNFTIENMTIFHRLSTTSRTIFDYPGLFAIWCVLCACTFLSNFDLIRRKYKLAHMKSLLILQYTGFIFLALTFAIPVPNGLPPFDSDADTMRYIIHAAMAAIYGLANAAFILIFCALRRNANPFAKKFFAGCIVFAVLTTIGMAVMPSGFMETIPQMLGMAMLYVFNFTDLMEEKKLEKNHTTSSRSSSELMV